MARMSELIKKVNRQNKIRQQQFNRYMARLETKASKRSRLDGSEFFVSKDLLVTYVGLTEAVRNRYRELGNPNVSNSRIDAGGLTETEILEDIDKMERQLNADSVNINYGIDYTYKQWWEDFKACMIEYQPGRYEMMIYKYGYNPSDAVIASIYWDPMFIPCTAERDSN